MGLLLRPFLVLTGLSAAFCVARTLVVGEPLLTALTGGLFRSLAGGSLAAALTFAAAAPLRRGGISEASLRPKFVAGWALPGAAFTLGTWITAVLAVEGLPDGYRAVGEPMAWVVIGAIGAAAGYAWGGTWWAVASPVPGAADVAEGEGDPVPEGAAERGSGEKWGGITALGRWAWVPALVAALVVLARGEREREQRQAWFELSERARALVVPMMLDSLRGLAPPGTPAPHYAEAAAQVVDGWRSRWYPRPFVQRLTRPLYGDDVLEVIFLRGRVVGYRSGPVRPLEPFPAESAAARLGLSPELPIFDERVGEAADSARPPPAAGGVSP